MRLIIILFWLLLNIVAGYPQHSFEMADSLEQQLFFTEETTEQIHLNSELARIYLSENPEKSLKYADRAIELSSLVRADKQEAIAYYYQGISLSKLLNKGDAVSSFLFSKKLFGELKEKRWIGEVCYELGCVYKDRLDFENAVSELLEGLSIVQEIGDKDLMAKFLNLIGGVYYDQGDYEKAFDYFKRSKDIWESQGNRKGASIQYNNIGEIYRYKGELDRALSYYRKAVSINTELSFFDFLSINYDNIGNIYLSLGQYDSADFYLEKSLKMAQLMNDPNLISMVNISLGYLHMENSENELALAHFEEAYELSLKNQLNEHTKDAAYRLSLVYVEKNDFENALIYRKKFRELKDSVTNAYNVGKITEMELKLRYGNEQKLKEIQQQNSQFLYILFAVGIFAFIVILIMFYGRLKINIRHSKSKAVNLYLANKHLEEDIDFKNRELATNVMYLLKKNELISYISDKLLKAKVKFKRENQPFIEETILELQTNVNKEIWSEFEKRFQAVHKGFYDELNERYPNLTSLEKKLCALLRLNMSTKEIAAISHQSPNSVEVARTRLRKKLELSNKDVGLVSFLSNL